MKLPQSPQSPNLLEQAPWDEINAIVDHAHERKDYRPTVLAVIVDAKRDKVLFLRSKKNPKWVGPPQGGAKQGEHVFVALLRELREELGISFPQSAIHNFLGAAYGEYRPDQKERDGFTKGRVYLPFLIQYEGDGKLTLDKEENDLYFWVDRKNLPKFLHRVSPLKRKILLNALGKWGLWEDVKLAAYRFRPKLRLIRRKVKASLSVGAAKRHD